MAELINNPYPLFTDEDGQPLDSGYVYIGEQGLNPLSNPLQAYWDFSLTVPATDIRTMNGYLSYNGSPGILYADTGYSILIQDKNGVTVFYQPTSPVSSGGGGGSSDASGATIIDGVLGETVLANSAVYFSTDGKVYLGDNRSGDTSSIAGITIGGGILGVPIKIQKIGLLDGFIGLSTGSPYYLGQDGSILMKGSLADDALVVYLGTAISPTTLDIDIRPALPLLPYNDEPLTTVKSLTVSDDSWMLSHGWMQFAYNNPISQSNYSTLFDKIGHMFNAQHVAAGDADLSASTSQFYPTPVPGKYGRSGMPDINFVNTDIAATLLTYSTPSGFRDGKIFRYELLTGTTVSGLSDGTEYFLRRVSSTTISIHATEAHAIANTSPIAITAASAGTFRLTQEGIAIDDAVGEHEHIIGATLNATGGTANDTISNTGTGTRNNNETIGFYSGSTSNETRGTTFYQFDYIKAEAILATGEPVSAERYDTGWIANSDWTGNSLLINHNLNMDLANIDTDFYITTDSGDDGCLLLGGASYSTTGVTEEYNYVIQAVDNNSFIVQLGFNGLVNYNSSGDRVLITNQPYHYKVVVTKPNLLANQLIVPDDVDFGSSTTDVTKTLPAPSEIIGTRTYTRKGSGSGKLILAVPTGVTVDWGDATVLDGTIELEGTGKVVVRASGGNIKIDEYEDSGSNANGSWEKSLYGVLNISFPFTTALGGASSHSLPYFFISNNYRFLASPANSATQTDVTFKASGKTTTTINITGTAGGGYTALICDVLLIGRWRA